MSLFQDLRSSAGQFVFNRLIFPRESPLCQFNHFDGDYGHGFLYEELFAGDGSDINFARNWVARHPGTVLDLAGGAGRLSIALASDGARVFLVDRSHTMISRAMEKIVDLSVSTRSNLSVYPSDIVQLEIDQKFTNVFSLNNGLEHLNTEFELLGVLRNVYRHLNLNGSFFLDVHNPDFFENQWYFKKGIWHYTMDKKIEEVRYRVWSRTLEGAAFQSVRCEHALSENLTDFLILKSSINLYSIKQWNTFFQLAGFKIVSCFGDWRGSVVNTKLPKLVFHLKKADACV